MTSLVFVPLYVPYLVLFHFILFYLPIILFFLLMLFFSLFLISFSTVQLVFLFIFSSSSFLLLSCSFPPPFPTYLPYLVPSYLRLPHLACPSLLIPAYLHLTIPDLAFTSYFNLSSSYNSRFSVLFLFQLIFLSHFQISFFFLFQLIFLIHFQIIFLFLF
jgi:hypothetical protein